MHMMICTQLEDLGGTFAGLWSSFSVQLCQHPALRTPSAWPPWTPSSVSLIWEDHQPQSEFYLRTAASVWAVIWGNNKAQLICFLCPADHCPLLFDVQRLQKTVILYLSFFFFQFQADRYI